jgi:hypothetical protein
MSATGRLAVQRWVWGLLHVRRHVQAYVAARPAIGKVTSSPGESVITCPSPLNVLKYTYDHSCYGARSDEYQHLMPASPRGYYRPRWRSTPRSSSSAPRGPPRPSSCRRALGLARIA